MLLLNIYAIHVLAYPIKFVILQKLQKSKKQEISSQYS